MKTKHFTIELTLDLIQDLLRGKKLEQVAVEPMGRTQLRITILPPQGGVFLTYEEYANLRLGFPRNAHLPTNQDAEV